MYISSAARKSPAPNASLPEQRRASAGFAILESVYSVRQGSLDEIVEMREMEMVSKPYFLALFRLFVLLC